MASASTARGARPGFSAFSLLEVMIAIGIFFMVAFAILALVSQCLRQARALEQIRTPIGAIASDAMLVEPVEEGLYNGEFGDVHPDHRWEADVYFPDFVTNETLFAIDLKVRRSGQSQADGEITILRFQPGNRAGQQAGAFWE
jgi:hypothetical protein